MSSLFTAYNCEFEDASVSMAENSTFTLYNTKIDETLVLSYTDINIDSYSISIDHNQVPNAFAAWTKGGYSSYQTTVFPDGYTGAIETILNNSNYYSFWQKEVMVQPGTSVNIYLYLRKSSSMSYLPRFVIFDKVLTEPLLSSEEPLYTYIMSDSIDTWESTTYTYTNTNESPVYLTIRGQGIASSGTFYSVSDVEVINVDLTNAIALINEVKVKTDNIPLVPAPANEYDARMATIQADLDNPSQYKADISGLALESTLAAIKGAGWTTETLKSIKEAISLIPEGITIQDLKDIVIEGDFTFYDLLKVIPAALAGKLIGGGTGTLHFRNLMDTIDRITAEVDLETGDRTSITLDLT